MQELPSEEQPAVQQPQHSDVGYHIRSGGHDVTPYDWQCYLDFLDALYLSPHPAEEVENDTRDVGKRHV